MFFHWFGIFGIPVAVDLLPIPVISIVCYDLSFIFHIEYADIS
jgi:hypothetical protein